MVHLLLHRWESQPLVEAATANVVSRLPPDSVFGSSQLMRTVLSLRHSLKVGVAQRPQPFDALPTVPPTSDTGMVKRRVEMLRRHFADGPTLPLSEKLRRGELAA